MENKMKLRLKCVPKSVDIASTMVATFASLNCGCECEVSDIECAVEAVVSNCVDHACGDTLDPKDVQIDIRVAIIDKNLVVTVRDNGVGIASVKRARMALFTTRTDRNNGLGFSVMETFMDEVRVSSKLGKGTTVTMKKWLTGN